MNPRLNVEKLLQMMAVLLQAEGVRAMDRLRLLKLLYIADRECLRETGSLMLGARMVAMPHGPLHSEVLDVIKGQHMAAPRYAQFFQNQGRVIHLIKDPGRGELSRYDVAKLNELSVRYSDTDSWQLVEETHNFPEWKEHSVENSSQTIPLEHLIEAVDRKDDKEEILKDIEAHNTATRFFESLS